MRTRKRVFVALSGGVDSAVCLSVLKEKGYQVWGVYMRTWSPPDQPCPWKRDRLSAMRICAQIGVGFKEWDFRKDYYDRVVTEMLREYGSGRTPNPDVSCNKEIKFGLFFNRALKEGADYVATGHYARIRANNKKLKTNSQSYELLRAKDLNKDQSYFLWTLTQEQLRRTLFPVGEFESKVDVRKYARSRNLHVAERADSQGVCFIGPIDVSEFLRKRISVSAGPIVSTNGRNLGTHDGVSFYTIGERAPLGGAGPYYVMQKIAATNTLVVSSSAEEYLLHSDKLAASSINWIGERPNPCDKIQASIRYRQHPETAVVTNLQPSTVNLQFDGPVRAITPGQSVVMYNNNIVLGGGIIESHCGQ